MLPLEKWRNQGAPELLSWLSGARFRWMAGGERNPHAWQMITGTSSSRSVLKGMKHIPCPACRRETRRKSRSQKNDILKIESWGAFAWVSLYKLVSTVHDHIIHHRINSNCSINNTSRIKVLKYVLDTWSYVPIWCNWISTLANWQRAIPSTNY